MKKSLIVYAMAVMGAASSEAVNVFFDNDLGNLNYFAASNWSDNATVPHGASGFTDTASISNFNISITSNLDFTGNGAVLHLLNGTAFTIVSNAVQLGIGSGCCGSTVIVDSGAVLRGQGSPSGG